MNPTGFYTYFGTAKTDLIDVFNPLTTTKTSNTGFRSTNNNNNDLSEMFEPYISGIKANTTNYKVFSTGLDLCDTFKPTEFPTKTDQLYNIDASLYWMTIHNNWALAVRKTGGGVDSTIYYSNNYGKNWSPYTNASWTAGIEWSGIAAYGTNAIACSTNKVWITSDYGETWTERTPSTNPLYLGVAIYETNVIVTDASNNKLYSSPNLGITWYAQNDTDITFPRNVSITKTVSNQFVVVVCCTSTNTGTTAFRVVRRIPYDFNSAANGLVILSTLVVFPITVSLDGSYGIIGAYQGTISASAGYSRIKYTTDAGATWADSKNASDNTNISDNIYVCSLSGNIGIAITYTSKYLISIDAGQTWTSYTTPSGNIIYSCAIHNKRIVMSESSASGVFVYYGVPRVPFPTISQNQISSTANTQVSAMYKNIVLSVNRSEGLMRRSTDGGASFSQVIITGYTNESWRYVAMDQTQAIAVSTDNVFTSNNSGATWTVRSPTSTNFVGCAVYNGLMIVADQANSRLYYSTDNGANWLFQTASFPRGCAITTDGGYTVTYSSMDSTLGTSALSFKCCSGFNPDVDTNEFVDCSFNGIAPLNIALDGNYGVCVSYTGTLPAIKYSSDYGRTWLLSDVIPTANMTSVSISGRFAIVTAGGYDSYYVSNDYGQTWTTLSGPQTLVDCASNYLNYFTLFTMSATSSFHYYGQADNLRPVPVTVSGFTTASTALTTNSTSIQSACMYLTTVIAVSDSGGAMRRSTDSGASFATIAIASYTNESWRYVAMDQTQAIAVSTDNVFTSNNSGATWTVRINVPTFTNFTGCAIYKGLMMVADQANSTILYSTNNGASWLSQAISFPRGCAIAMDGTAYVVLVTGMDSATGAIPQYLLICDNFDPTSTTNGFYSPVYNEPHPFLVALDGKYGVACRRSDVTNKTILYSANFGRTWTEISENITADCSALSISNGYAMVRQTGSATYYISNNYGQNWQSRTAPNPVTMVANFSDKGTFFTRSGTSTFAYNGTLI